MKQRATNLISKSEALSLLWNKTAGYWSLIKFILSIPLILTSSIMCVLNSFESENNQKMRLPNIIVNAMSVLVLSVQNNLKASEKVELFKSLAISYIELAHSIEALEDEEFTRENLNTFTQKYDDLLKQTLFEDIQNKHKKEVMILFEGKALPLSLNGSSGIVIVKRNSPKSVSKIEISSEIV
jgi:hypothetical protein